VRFRRDKRRRSRILETRNEILETGESHRCELGANQTSNDYGVPAARRRARASSKAIHRTPGSARIALAISSASAESPRVRAIAPANSAGSNVGTKIGTPRAKSRSSSARLSGWWGSVGESALTPPHLADCVGERCSANYGSRGKPLAQGAVLAPCRVSVCLRGAARRGQHGAGDLGCQILQKPHLICKVKPLNRFLDFTQSSGTHGRNYTQCPYKPLFPAHNVAELLYSAAGRGTFDAL